MRIPGLRRVGAAVSISVLAVSGIAGPAIAADTPQILATTRDSCVTLVGRTNATLKLIQKRNGTPIDSATGTQSKLCVKPVLAGDTLVATDTFGDVLSNEFTIPALSVIWSPQSNLVRVTGPADTIVVISVKPSTAGIYGVGTGTSDQTDAQGKASWQPPAQLTPHGSDRVEVWFQGSTPLQRLTSRNALKSATVTPGSASVRGTAPVGSSTTVRLSRGGKVIGTVIGKASNGDATWTGTFRSSSGAKVKAKAGDKVSIVGVAGSTKVRTPDLVVVSDGGTESRGSLTATCAPGSEWLLGLDGTFGLTDVTASGAVAIDMLSNSGPLPFGTKVQLACESPSGVGQVFTVFAPAVG